MRQSMLELSKNEKIDQIPFLFDKGLKPIYNDYRILKKLIGRILLFRAIEV